MKKFCKDYLALQNSNKKIFYLPLDIITQKKVTTHLKVMYRIFSPAKSKNISYLRLEIISQ